MSNNFIANFKKKPLIFLGLLGLVISVIVATQVKTRNVEKHHELEKKMVDLISNAAQQGEHYLEYTYNDGTIQIHNTASFPLADCKFKLSKLGKDFYYTKSRFEPDESVSLKFSDFLNSGDSFSIDQSGDYNASFECTPVFPKTWQEIYKEAVAEERIYNIDDDDDLSKKDKELLKKAAVSLIQNEPKCHSVLMAFPSTEQKGYYTFDCNDGRGNNNSESIFHIKASELYNGKPLQAPSVFPEDKAKTLCEDVIKSHAAHPSTVSMDILSYETLETTTLLRTINQEFTAKNAFGLERRFRSWCYVSPDGSGSITIKEFGSPDGEVFKF